MVEKALKNYHTSYQDIAKKIAPDVSDKTIKRRLSGKNLKKCVVQERVHLDKALAQKRLKWAFAHRHWTKNMWRRKAMCGDEITIEKGGGRRRKWIFRYPEEK